MVCKVKQRGVFYLAKSENDNILSSLCEPPIVGRTRFFSLGEATSLGEGKL